MNPYAAQPPAFELVTPVDASTLDPLPRSLYATSTPLVCRIHGMPFTLPMLARRLAYGYPMPDEAMRLLEAA